MSRVVDDTGAFEVTTEMGEGRALLIVSGELDSHTAPTFDGAIDALPDAVAEIAIDLADVGFIDSSGLRVLIRARRRLGDTPGSLTLRNPSPSLIRLLEITGLSDHFPIEPLPIDTLPIDTLPIDTVRSTRPDQAPR